MKKKMSKIQHFTVIGVCLLIKYNKSNNCAWLLHSLGIIYGVFSVSNLLAPAAVAVIGPKITMLFSGLLYR